MGWDDSDEDDWENDDKLDEKIAQVGQPASNKQVWSDEEEEDEDEVPAAGGGLDDLLGGGSVTKSDVKQPVKQKHLKKKMLNEKEEKEKVARLQEEEDEEDEDAIAKKLRLQELVEKEDFENAIDVFGMAGASKDPVLPAEFEKLGEAIAARVCQHQASFHYVAMLKVLLKDSCANMEASDIKDVKDLLSKSYNAKTAAQAKLDGKKKKKGGAMIKQDREGASEWDDY